MWRLSVRSLEEMAKKLGVWFRRRIDDEVLTSEGLGAHCCRAEGGVGGEVMDSYGWRVQE